MGLFDWLFSTDKDNGAKRKDRGIFEADEDADFECDQCGEYFEDCECDDCGDDDCEDY